jgi:hypothetical protein
LTTVCKHRTPVEREQILEDYRRSQLTQKQFATQSGVSVSTLQAWLRKIPSRAAPPGPAFLAVPNLLSPAPAAPAYRLQWPDGLSLEIGSGFVSGELAALLQLLPAL